MSAVEVEHAEMVKLERLAWLCNTMATLYTREISEPGSVDDSAVMMLHASAHSWVTRLLALDVPV